MKIYIKLFAVAMGLFMLSSCNDLLDLENNDGHTNMDEAWTDRNSTLGYLNSCYNYRAGLDLDVSSLTDEAVDSRMIIAGTKFQYWYDQGITTENYGGCSYDGHPWTRLYNGIRKCNVFLAHIDNATAYCLPEERASWKAQAYVLRAYYYLELFKRYGQVPLLTEDIGTNHDYSKASKAKVGDIVKQIIADCDSALATPTVDLGFSWSIGTNQNGIMTRGVAYAIEAEAITFAVSPLFNDDTFTWNDALNVTKNALYQCLTHDYSLWTKVVPGAQNAYDSYFFADYNDNRVTDKETIYAVNGRSAIWLWYGLPTNDGVSQAGVCPSQELVDAYNMASTGEMAITGYQDTEHTRPIVNSASGYDETKPYEGRDPRFYASIYYNGAIRFLDKPNGKKVQTYEGGEEQIDRAGKSVKNTPTGYYLRKYNHYASTKASNSDGFVRLFRLADLYLYFAEAAYQAGTPDAKVSLGGNMTMSAVDAVNAIRARVGMPGLKSGLSKAEFETRLRNERMVEFAFEGKRFFDVRRWKALGTYFKNISGMDIKKNNDSYQYTRFAFKPRVSVTDKYLLYPLEKSEVTKMDQLTGAKWQNAGWEE